MSTLQQAVAILMLFAKVAWRASNNYRRLENYGDGNDIRNSLAEYQWVRDNPVPATVITDDERDAELSERQTQWDALKSAPQTPEALAKLTVFELLYTEPKVSTKPEGERKLIVPEYSGNAGFRRAANFFAAMVQRFQERAKPGKADLDIHCLVPIRVTTYATDADRIIDQQMENEMQGRGTVKMDDLDKLRVTKALYDAGCIESKVRKLYSSSTGQKTFNICALDQYFPALNIYKRFLLPSTDPDFLPWGPFRGADLVKFTNRAEATAKKLAGRVLTADEKGLPELTEEEVRQMLADKAKSAGDGNAPKTMKKTDIEGGAKQHKLLVARQVFGSVIDNSTANLKKYTEHADSLNGVTTLIDGGKGGFADETVNNAVANEAIFGKVNAVLKAGKGPELIAALDAILNPPAPAAAPAAPSNSSKGDKTAAPSGKKS